MKRPFFHWKTKKTRLALRALAPHYIDTASFASYSIIVAARIGFHSFKCTRGSHFVRHRCPRHVHESRSFSGRIFVQDRRGQDVDHQRHGRRPHHRRRIPRLCSDWSGTPGHQHVPCREGKRSADCDVSERVRRWLCPFPTTSTFFWTKY